MTNEVAEYYDGLLDKMAKYHVSDNSRHEWVKTELTGIIRKNSTVLDIGCGTGITSIFMAKMGGTVTAVDISPKLIDFAKVNSASEYVAYSVQNAATMRLGKTFDLIAMVDVFEHFPRANIGRVMKTIARHSHNGTAIYLNLPDARYQDAAHKYIPGRLQIIDEGYSIQRILALFSEIGFEPIKISIYGIECPIQYNSFFFIRRDSIAENHHSFMASFPNG
jgi:SAM-dependent methyltransferase